MFVSVEASDQTLAMRIELVLEEVHRHRRAGDRLAVQVDHSDMELQVFFGHHPRIGLEPDEHIRRPQGDTSGDCLGLAVGIAELKLRQDFPRLNSLRQIRDCSPDTADMI